MFEKEITFDRLARWVIMAVVVLAVVFLLKKLSSVLLPFFIGWFIAYLLYPVVKFVQYKMKVGSRVLSIIIAFLLLALLVFEKSLNKLNLVLIKK